MLEKNLDRIARLAEEKDDENWHFRSFLQQIGMTPEELDEIVQITNTVPKIVSPTLTCKPKASFSG